jgi:hypothetical protein
MTTDVGWHWGVSNISAGELLLWLEPWAEEYAVSSRSTLTLKIINPNSDAASVDVEDTGARLVVWAKAGETVEICIDGSVQNSEFASVKLSFPETPGKSMKELLDILFSQHPEARLGGQDFVAQQSPSVWQRLKHRLGM